jgi:dolichyl-phosphate beta-glucosyltransferase
MLEGYSVSLIVPAYNEARAISQTITDAKNFFASRDYPFEIIISVQGNDGTQAIVAEMAAHDPALKLLYNPEHHGKGLAIREAVFIAQGAVIGFADADNKTPIEEFVKFEPWLKKDSEIVIGSRGMSESVIERRQSLYRRIGARSFGWLMHAIVGLPEISDTQCGFKFFQRQAAIDLFSRQRIDGYTFDVEILYLASQLEYRIVQIPVRWRDDRDTRRTLAKDNLKDFFDLLSIRFSPHPKRHTRLSDNSHP